MMVRVAMAACLFLGLVLCSAAGTDTPKKLVGTWECTKLNGKAYLGKMVWEFGADGKYTHAEMPEKGSLETMKGTYTVKDEVITMVYVLKFKGKDKEDRMTYKVKKLTDTELHLQSGSETFTELIELKRVSK
jgi:uncharacterized protein (TIGR03066 family)